jgi:2-oxo-4-hydroxy-4-carboxy-5-ureidoimidazoline decarboxylase
MDGVPQTSKAVFLEQFRHIFEHSPWVVERAWERRPFTDGEALHAAFMAEVAAAGDAAQLDLIKAHPELAARVALTEASSLEQMGAGLKALSAAEFERFSTLNAAYREKFGFPFVICVGLQTKASILVAFEQRLQRDAAAEQAEAIAQIGLIAKLRLQALQTLQEGAKG